MELFGFEFKKKVREKEKEKNLPKSFADPDNTDGALKLTQSGSFVDGQFHSQFLTFDSSAKTEFDLIKLYRDMAMNPEVDGAIDDVVNEAIVPDEEKPIVSISLDTLEGFSDNIKEKIKNEFDNVLELLRFEKDGQDLFKKWYVDARLYHHIVVSEDEEERKKNGIGKLVLIDPLQIKKIEIIRKEKNDRGVDVVVERIQKFVYTPMSQQGLPGQPVEVASEAISYVHSGLLSKDKKFIVGHLHKAIKPLNQLKSVEDATVIYRLSRAPERRVFYIDVGNLPKGKAEQYVNNIMVKYKNKLIYNAATGETEDQRNHMSMQEDFFLPRREGGKGTEITTLQGGQNLGEMEDVDYFRRKFMKSLNVPISRLESESTFNLGRSSEINRDEVKFGKFVGRLLNKFSNLFNNLLRTQLLLKAIVTEDDWKKIQEDLQFDWNQDSYFTELKEAEILKERISLVTDLNEYVGRYFSLTWVRKNILKQSEDDIKQIDKEMKAEQGEGKVPEDDELSTAQLGGAGMPDEEVPGEDESPKEPAKEEESLNG